VSVCVKQCDKHWSHKCERKKEKKIPALIELTAFKELNLPWLLKTSWKNKSISGFTL
jgi:hypothetical protein